MQLVFFVLILIRFMTMFKSKYDKIKRNDISLWPQNKHIGAARFYSKASQSAAVTAGRHFPLIDCAVFILKWRQCIGKNVLF